MQKYIIKTFITILLSIVIFLSFIISVHAYAPSGILSVDEKEVRYGTPVTITITGRDDDGLVALKAYYHGMWDTAYVTAISTARSWRVLEEAPGIYEYCGQVVGRTLLGKYEYSATTPSCIKVTVLPFEYSSPSQTTDNYFACYNNDVYEYSSLGTRIRKYQECGNNYCEDWSPNYCIGNNVYTQRTCYNKGCESNSCYSDSYTEKKLIQTCSSNQICQNGKCVESPKNQCSSGACCQNNLFKSSDSICSSQSETEYGCPWGTSLGSNVGKRTRIRLQYCSGNSSLCNGSFGPWLSWSEWTIADYCSSNQVCVPGKNRCQDVESINNNTSIQPIPKTQMPQYIKYFKTACYNNDLYWFDSNNKVQIKYQECPQDTECINDGCVEINKTKNNIKNEVTITVLASTKDEPLLWLKKIETKPEDIVNILFIVENKKDYNINNINIETNIPKEINDIKDIKINNISLLGDIRKGINLNSLEANSVKTISFKGKIDKNAENKEIEITAKLNNEKTSNTDSLKINIKKASNMANILGLAAIKSFTSKWYFWVFIIVILIYTAYIVFRKLFGVPA